MSYYVADPGASITYPVTSQATPPQPVDFPVVVRAVRTDDTTDTIAGADWNGAAAATRNVRVPLGSLDAGLWSLRLVIDDEPDLFLGNVYIE